MLDAKAKMVLVQKKEERGADLGRQRVNNVPYSEGCGSADSL